MSDFKPPKSLGHFFASADKQEEIYLSEKRKRLRRANKGYFFKGGGAFDFIYLIRNWDKIVGKLMSQNTIPHKILKNTLIIMTKHNVFAQELSFMAPQIIQKIEENVPELRGKITKIKFSHANYSWDEFQNSSVKKQGFQAAPQNKLHPYSPQFQQKKKQAQELFHDIEDEDVKELLTSIFIEKL